MLWRPLALVACVLPVLCSAASADVPLSPLKPHPEVQYELPWTTGPEGFNLKLRLSDPDGVFVAFNHQDSANHYCLSLEGGRAGLFRVERGLLLPLTETELKRGGKPLLLKRRRSVVELYEGSERRLRFCDGTFRGGRVGLGGPSLKKALAASPRFQPVGPVYFSDDFMRGENEPGAWDCPSGEWKVKSLRNPLRSANAFKFIGKTTGEVAVALTGHWFWDRYECSAAFRSPDASPVGLFVGYQDKGNHFRCEWRGKHGSDVGQIRLVQVTDGEERELLAEPIGFAPGQWYLLSVVMVGDGLRVSVDGNEVGKVSLPGLIGGKIGLFTKSPEGTLFDDVVVRSVFDYRADFSEMAEGRWACLGGTWKPSGSSVTASSSGRALAVVGDEEWFDYTAETLAEGADGAAGLVCHFQDAFNYCALIREGEARLKLIRVLDGKEETLAEAQLDDRLLRPRTLRLALRNSSDLLTGLVDGRALVQAEEARLGTGLAGLCANGKGYRFTEFSVTFAERDRAPLRTHNPVFAHEYSMANWASAEGDWAKEQQQLDDGRRAALGWHRVDMPGDAEIRMPLPEFPARDSAGASMPSSVWLVLSAAEHKLGEGYRLEMGWSGSTQLSLWRGEVMVHEQALRKRDVTSLRLRRAGSYLLGYVNGQREVVYQDKEPLAGNHTGWGAVLVEPDLSRVQVYADSVVAETFETAPTDWLVAEGDWEVSNRWQCDPRWSFFSGAPLAGRKRAVIWSKRELPPEELSVELTVGQKMERERGDYSKYARDYNLTICADGNRLDSGYSFVFGGWGNKRTAILRGTQVVAETETPVIDTRGLHRRWYVLKASKKGGRLRYFVDGKLVLSYDDPTPLRGERFAVWSYENGIMIPRVRISCPGPSRRAAPSAGAGATAVSFYDVSTTDNNLER